MAQKVQVLLVDDIDGGEARETISFALDGVTYDIDLSEANAEKLRTQMATWIGHARRAGGRKVTGRRAGGAAAGRRDLNAVREWGRANGFQVSDRGRVSGELQSAYERAHA
ncbi:Nucleoid-associated protein Lsr2 [Austwickia sp. TVS 96-490-7B]|uniref:histone-like nucleoid-structuring protein Lsr2 n=1 Tax=Austwickia sp. TVS 96-490-7B TaxID=2830843 RepID=UPI001C56CDD5|nr:Lsr2 family protein [Austwickia sp. TVS 96-490-7B]MBW3084816.1 Nucleoid-associated protein Lsr2 [Austwickia sp. TVS 96-490-7B]